jgi:glyoxylase-like metal-dependent hydrolase (beta-lactamase superfamily II)
MTRKQWQVKALRGGGIILDRSAMTHFKGKGQTIDVPIWFLAATDGKHKIIIDTGIYEIDWVKNGPEPGCHQNPDEKTDNSVKKNMGWDASEVDYVINTHLHYDHCGGNQYFTKATHIVQKVEWESAWNPIESEKVFYNDMFFGRDAVNYFQWKFIEGEHELLPGLILLPTPGHTRGHQSVLLDTIDGVLCVSGDICNVAENINENLEPNIVVDTKQVYESFKEIRRRAHCILPGHEPSIADGTTRGFPKIR